MQKFMLLAVLLSALCAQGFCGVYDLGGIDLNAYISGAVAPTTYLQPVSVPKVYISSGPAAPTSYVTDSYVPSSPASYVPSAPAVYGPAVSQQHSYSAIPLQVTNLPSSTYFTQYAVQPVNTYAHQAPSY